MKILPVLLLPLFCLTTPVCAQAPETVPLPVLFPVQQTVYMSPAGSDTATGDSLNPVATFTGALNILAAWSDGQQGELHTEVVLFPGYYTTPLVQPWSRFQLPGRRLNISVRGKGSVMLDGLNGQISSGQGMVHLLGSHIRVANLNILYSPGNGVRFGYDANGNVSNPHDVLVENVTVRQTAGHGILLGISPVKNSDPFSLHPPGERYMVRQCTVYESVNFNQPQSQWGSAVKFHNVRYGLAENCHIYDNSGEGIDVDFGEQIIIRANTLHDNYANIYIDKGVGIRIEGNHIHNDYRKVPGILLGIEAFTGLITDHYIKDVAIHNNIILNTTTGISIWQGIYSFLQKGIFSGIDIRHNTIVGQRGQKAAIGFSYETLLGNPTPNVVFSNLYIYGNILSAHPDSLNNGRLLTAPLNPQPGLLASCNLWNLPPGPGYNQATDQSRPQLPDWAVVPDTLSFRPGPGNPVFLFGVPASAEISEDLLGLPRNISTTNAGALEVTGVSFTHEPETTVKIYPNPASNLLSVDGLPEGKVRYSIIGTDGSEKSHNEENVASRGTVEIKLSEMAPGTYLLRVTLSRSGKVVVLPFVKL